jgi:hypothetical protein
VGDERDILDRAPSRLAARIAMRGARKGDRRPGYGALRGHVCLTASESGAEGRRNGQVEIAAAAAELRALAKT